MSSVSKASSSYQPRMALSRLASDIRSGQSSPAATFGKGLAFFLGAVTVVPVIADALTTQLAKHRGQPLFSSGTSIRGRHSAPDPSSRQADTKNVAWGPYEPTSGAGLVRDERWQDGLERATHESAILALHKEILTIASGTTSAQLFFSQTGLPPFYKKDLDNLAAEKTLGKKLRESVRKALKLEKSQIQAEGPSKDRFDHALNYIESRRSVTDSFSTLDSFMTSAQLSSSAKAHVRNTLEEGHSILLDDLHQLQAWN